MRLLQGFGEIAFCAVTAHEQVKGFGTRLMNYTKVRPRIAVPRTQSLAVIARLGGGGKSRPCHTDGILPAVRLVRSTTCVISQDCSQCELQPRGLTWCRGAYAGVRREERQPGVLPDIRGQQRGGLLREAGLHEGDHLQRREGMPCR